jgi:hypothetical protein
VSECQWGKRGEEGVGVGVGVGVAAAAGVLLRSSWVVLVWAW